MSLLKYCETNLQDEETLTDWHMAGSMKQSSWRDLPTEIKPPISAGGAKTLARWRK